MKKTKSKKTETDKQRILASEISLRLLCAGLVDHLNNDQAFKVILQTIIKEQNHVNHR